MGLAACVGSQAEIRSGVGSEVVEAARQRLDASPYRALWQIECRFDDGRLHLRGRLSSFFHKQLAQEAVARLTGVRQVVNEIEVRETHHAGAQPK